MPGLPGGDGHSGWLVSSSKGVLNLWETSRAVPGETVLLVGAVVCAFGIPRPHVQQQTVCGCLAKQ